MGKQKQKSSNVTVVDKPKIINVEYQLLVSERDDLLENENAYKKRIEQLEKDATDMLKSFDILYNENKILRSKLGSPGEAGVDSVESYNSVFQDREHLREANKAFKRRIKQLEEDAEEAKKEYDKLNTNHKLVTQRAQLETEFATRSKDEKISDLEREQEEINEKLKMFLKEREQYEYRIAEMDKERNEMQNKIDFLSQDKYELQLRCDVLQADREKLKEKVSDLELQVPDAEQKAKEEQQFLGLQAQLAALQVSNKDASVEIFNLKEEIRNLNKFKTEKKEMVDRASSVIVDENALEIERQAAAKQMEIADDLQDTKKRCKLLLKENDRLKTENVELESKAANFELENKKLNDELKTKSTQIEDMSVLVKGGEALNDDYDALQNKLQDVSAMKQALENELLQEKRLSKLKIMELENEIKKLTEKLNELKKQEEKTNAESQHLSHEYEGLQKVSEAQSLELRNMKAQLEQMQSMFEDKNMKYEQMKNTEKESVNELREARIELHTVKRELADLKMEKRGTFGILKQEMEKAKTDRDEEKEQLRKETKRLKLEVEKLKDYEFKITTMDKEIRRLMNRIRISERYIKIPHKSKEKGETGDEKEEIKELRRKQREMEKEKMTYLQEKKKWEVLKDKYADLLNNNRRLVEENKRIRGDLDGTNYKVDALEKKFRGISVKSDDAPGISQFQKATYVDKSSKKIDNKKKSTRFEPPTFLTQADGDFEKTIPKQGRFRDRRKPTRKSTITSIDISRMKSKKPKIPAMAADREVTRMGPGYSELHKNRYKPKASLALL